MAILSAFHKFANEGAIVGRILASYSDLEIGLMNCVQVATGDFDSTLKAMFRARGETQRLDIADALGRQVYTDSGLGTEFAMAVGAVRYCLKIRNQYSHCVWWDDWTGKLAIADLEEIAVDNARLHGLTGLTAYHVDVALLRSQEAYFEHADELITWVNYERRVLTGALHKHVFQKPKQQARPALRIP